MRPLPKHCRQQAADGCQQRLPANSGTTPAGCTWNKAVAYTSALVQGPTALPCTSTPPLPAQHTIANPPHQHQPCKQACRPTHTPVLQHSPHEYLPDDGRQNLPRVRVTHETRGMAKLGAQHPIIHIHRHALLPAQVQILRGHHHRHWPAAADGISLPIPAEQKRPSGTVHQTRQHHLANRK